MRKKYGDYFVTIGLEVHVALQTKQKLFSNSLNSFELNEFSLLDAGTPGVLPVLSKAPVEMAIAFGDAVYADIKKESFFERKHYFYPDLPLGYQITQQHHPILIGGKVKIKSGGEKWVEIEHAHLECDAAKSIHDLYNQYTAIDLSRCASPLLEIVSTPCMHSPEEAKEYVKEMHSLVTFMGICDGKLEEGSFRVDASISLSKTEKLGTRVEIKNISSFTFLQQALEFEIERQTELLNTNKIIDMETRLFNEKELATYSMRQKETVDEYRYMPDPDIMPLVFTDELIEQAKRKYVTNYFQLKEQLIETLTQLKVALKPEELGLLLSSSLREQWILFLSDEELQTERIAKMLAFWIPEVIELGTKKIGKEEILFLDKSNLQAKECKETLKKWLETELSLKDCIPISMADDEIVSVIEKVFAQFDVQVQKHKGGDPKMAGFLMGKVMSELKGSAPAIKVKELVGKCLK